MHIINIYNYLYDCYMAVTLGISQHYPCFACEYFTTITRFVVTYF